MNLIYPWHHNTIHTPSICSTALWYAARKGYPACTILLIRAGANVEAEGGNAGYTPILVAADDGHDECMRMLIDAGGKFMFTPHTT